MPTGLLSKVGIDCMLSKGGDGLRGDGCVYELSSSHPVILNPKKLRPGDYVKLRLWFPDEDTFSAIELAEVQWVKNEWIQIELLLVSSKDQSRLRQFVASEGNHPAASARTGQQIMIRA
ncbi:hypothetical protein COMA2_60163 [Candidatus Nitrospira nitrificans]|uniref:PilZ domain-containing protein n=1 Tax=Candidatus Nitrospira nitrificans TaxID=1742973 RepID=A0A0S4LQ90_9BACT|nr:hypothetical protein COMA2_60163 [Candidatus Nitrospira nitrificans]